MLGKPPSNVRYGSLRCKKKRKFAKTKSWRASLSVVPQSFDDTTCGDRFCHASRLASPRPDTVNVVRFYSRLAHGPRETPLYRKRGWCWSFRICCGLDVGSGDAAARTTRKPFRYHRLFRKRPANSIRPGAGNFGLRAPQECCSDLDGRSAQQERSSEPAAVTNSACRYHGDFYGIHNGGQ